jgi:hypothetical protein
MQEFVHLEADRPQLRNPLLLAAFGGAWGMSAVAALRLLIEQRDSVPLAHIEAGPFFDYTVQRPTVALEDGERVLGWPENRFVLLPATPERGSDRDLVLLLGTEPHFHWADFAAAVTSAMERLGVRESVTLGAYRAPTPHSRPLPLQLYTADEGLAGALGLPPEPWSYEGPASITTLIGVACEERGWPTASLIAAAPFYVTAEPHPHGELALVQTLSRAFGLDADVSALEAEVAALDREADDARGRSEPFASLVTNLEEEYDREASAFGSIDLAAAPAAPELLADVEAFLDAQRGSGGPGKPEPPTGA